MLGRMKDCCSSRRQWEGEQPRHERDCDSCKVVFVLGRLLWKTAAEKDDGDFLHMEDGGRREQGRKPGEGERRKKSTGGRRQQADKTGSRASTLEMLGQDKQTGTQHIANRFRRAAAGRRTIPSLSRQTGRCQLGGCTAIKDRLAIWMRRMDERCGGEKVGKPNAPGQKGGEADRVFASPTRFCPNRGERATLLKRQ